LRKVEKLRKVKKLRKVRMARKARLVWVDERRQSLVLGERSQSRAKRIDYRLDKVSSIASGEVLSRMIGKVKKNGGSQAIYNGNWASEGIISCGFDLLSWGCADESAAIMTTTGQ
jgi:hypothetical protein